MDTAQRFRMGGTNPRPITVILALRPGRPIQYRDLLDGEKFFSGPYLLCKLDWHRAAELSVNDSLLWEGMDPNATVYRAELGEGTLRPARPELPIESWCQPSHREP